MLYRFYKRKRKSCEKIQGKWFWQNCEPLTDHFDPSVVLNLLRSAPCCLTFHQQSLKFSLTCLTSHRQTHTKHTHEKAVAKWLSHDSQLLSCCALKKCTHTVWICPEETCLGQSASICCFTWKTWMRLDRGFIWVSEGESIKQIFGGKNPWNLIVVTVSRRGFTKVSH